MASRKQIVIRLLFCLLCTGSVFVSPAQGNVTICRCNQTPESLTETYDRAFGVFTGKVINIRQRLNPARTEVEFEVDKSWKGVRNETVTVFTEGTGFLRPLMDDLSCAYHFKRHETYLVFSFRHRNAQGSAWVSKCSKTAPLSESASFIEALGEPLHDFSESE